MEELNKLFEPLPTSSDDSPLPSPSELPAYWAKKCAEFKDFFKKPHPTTYAKVLHSPRIPPSGTPIKQDYDTSSSDSDLGLSDLEEKAKGNEYVQIGHLKPQTV